MRALKFTGSFVVLLASVASAVAYCESSPTIAQELQASSIVLVGAVRAAKDVVASDGSVCGTFYTVRVAESLKGSRSDKLELYCENSSGRFPMHVGMTYLIFANYEVFEGIQGPRPAINNCGNSASLPKGDKALAIVRKLTKA